MNINDEIKRTNKIIKLAKIKFYDQSLISSVQPTELGIHSIGFNVAKEVINLVDMVSMLERRIQLLRRKKRYLDDYLQLISIEKRNRLFEVYKNKKFNGELNQIELALYEEILEIEEAVNYMRGIEPDQTTDKLENNNLNLERDFSEIFNMLEEEG